MQLKPLLKPSSEKGFGHYFDDKEHSASLPSQLQMRNAVQQSRNLVHNSKFQRRVRRTKEEEEGLPSTEEEPSGPNSYRVMGVPLSPTQQQLFHLTQAPRSPKEKERFYQLGGGAKKKIDVLIEDFSFSQTQDDGTLDSTLESKIGKSAENAISTLNTQA